MGNEEQQINRDTSVNIQPIAIRFGLIASFVSILSSLMLYFFNLEYNGFWKWLPTILILAIIIITQKQVVQLNAPYQFSFGELFKFGFVIALISAIALLLYFILYSNFIMPDFIDKIMEVSRKQLEEKGMSEEQIESALEMSKKFMSPTLMMVMSFISSLIMGSLTALIGAGIFKNKKQ
ncbi:MAG: DUF4199 domain-containing protein [Chitinophagales bacterium]|nr:DUF4199 domain-containing protein [Bacteroidota bacterium]